MFNIKVKRYFLVFLLLNLVVSSCKNGSCVLNPQEFISWVNSPENGLVVKQTSGDYVFAIQYRPANYLALLETDPSRITKQTVDSVTKELGGIQQFMLRVELKSGQNNWMQASNKRFDDFDEQINYLSFKMQHDFKYINGQDTVECGIYHFERDYGIRPFGTFLLGFPVMKDQANEGDSISKQDDFKILFKDSAFGDSDIEFLFCRENIIKIPTLKL